MSNGWEPSAQAWIVSMGKGGERGDWGREHVLDPVMLSRVAAGRFDRAMTLAIVNVLPEPVTPSSVWNARPSVRPSIRRAIASG